MMIFQGQERPTATTEHDGFRTVDERMWADESAMLRHQLTLLEEYSRTQNTPPSIVSDAAECRMLQYQTQCLLATFATKGKLEDAQSFVDSRVASGVPRKPQRFDLWWQGNKNFKSQISCRPSSCGQLEGNFQCFEPTCQNYVYGFMTVDLLRRHLLVHHYQYIHSNSRLTHTTTLPNSPLMEFRILNQIAPRDHNSTNADETEQREGVLGPAPERRISSNCQVASLIPAIRLRTLPLSGKSSRSAPEISKALNACWRCKILEKKCDYRLPCTECPVRDATSSDCWKVLGCFQESLVGLADTCLPESFRDFYQHHHLNSLAFWIEFHDFPDPYIGTWANEIRFQAHGSAFRELRNECWDNRFLNPQFAVQIDTTENLPKVMSGLEWLNEYGVVFGLLKLRSWDPFYSRRTAFNPCFLFRMGNWLERRLGFEAQNGTWRLYREAKKLVISVIGFYQKELQITGLEENYDKAGRTSDEIEKISLPDVQGGVSTFLQAFDQVFSLEIILKPEEWLLGFYAFCVFGIARSLLMDTLSLRDYRSKPCPWTAADQMQIDAVYKVLVSVFTWSAKIDSWCPETLPNLVDPLLVDWTMHPRLAGTSDTRAALISTQDMVRASLWGDLGVKSTKDFLMGLGAGDILDFGFNGFLAQRHGSKKAEKARRDFHQEVAEVGTQVTMSTLTDEPTSPNLTSRRSISRSTPQTEPSPGSIGRFATSPQVSKTVQRSYEWERPEARMFELYNNGREVPSIVNSVIDECFGGSDSKNVPSYNAVKRRLLALMAKWKDSSQQRMSMPALELGSPDQNRRSPSVPPSLVNNHRKEESLCSLSRGQQKDLGPHHDAMSVSSTSNSYARASSTDHPYTLSTPGELGNLSENQSEIAPTKGIAPTETNKHAADPSNDYTFRVVAPSETISAHSWSSSEQILRMNIDSNRLNTPNTDSMTSTLPSMETRVFRIDNGITRSPPEKKRRKERLNREEIAKIRKIGACEKCRARKIKCNPNHRLEERYEGSPSVENYRSCK
ncbi:hypothetical protein BDZ45DRAFT_799538 [Acephala macrosclerotiorum]|nr:hypothetical protein BDZ45DRAFT_799538 [Acephala macrosclerotiorum]